MSSSENFHSKSEDSDEDFELNNKRSKLRVKLRDRKIKRYFRKIRK